MVWKKLVIIPSLGASGKQIVGSIDLCKMRSLVVTCRVTYNTSATAPLRINSYCQIHESDWDTVALDFFDINLTAGQTVQKTDFLAVPEEGQVQIEVVNTDTVYPATNIEIWVAYERWKEQ